MAEFAGLIHLDGRPIDPAAVTRLSRSVWSPGQPKVWRPHDDTVFVEGQTKPAHGAAAATPVQTADGMTLLIDAWLEAPAEVAAELGTVSARDHRALAAAACERWGVETAIDRLPGVVAIAAWQHDARRLILARDALGSAPLYYIADPRFILFASSLQAMLAMPEASRELDLVTVAHTMTIALQDQEQTIYRHIRRVPPGGLAMFERGQCRTSRYYSLARIAPVRLRSDQDYVEAARALLDQAVAARLPSDGHYACSLSGGFDSGGVTATAARLIGPARVTAWTRAPAHDQPRGGLDERDLAGKLVGMYDNIDWAVVDEAREAMRDEDSRGEAAATLLPRTSSFNATWFETMMLAIERSGATVLLNGGSGNLTLSHHGAAPLADDLRAGRWRKAVRDIAATSRRGGQAHQSLSRRTLAALYRNFEPRAVKRWRVQRSAGEMPWLSFSVVSPDFLGDLDYAAHARAVGHDIPFDLGCDAQEQRLRLLQAQRSRDFSGYVRRRRTVKTRDPYLDRALVEFCLGIPDAQYWRDGQDRWLARRVLADRMPAETLAQTTKGQQSSDWYGIASARRDSMAMEIDRIARSPLASRVIDVARMRALLDDWPKDADTARTSVNLHGHALQRGIAMGGFLRWHEGRND